MQHRYQFIDAVFYYLGQFAGYCSSFTMLLSCLAIIINLTICLLLLWIACWLSPLFTLCRCLAITTVLLPWSVVQLHHYYLGHLSGYKFMYCYLVCTYITFIVLSSCSAITITTLGIRLAITINIKASCQAIPIMTLAICLVINISPLAISLAITVVTLATCLAITIITLVC
jgi:hypothetical protein